MIGIGLVEGVACDDAPDDGIDVKIPRMGDLIVGRRRQTDVGPRHIAEDQAAVDQNAHVADGGQGGIMRGIRRGDREGNARKRDLHVVDEGIAAHDLRNDRAVRLDAAAVGVGVAAERGRKLNDVTAVVIDVHFHRQIFDDASVGRVDQGVPRRIGDDGVASAHQDAAESVFLRSGRAQRRIVGRKRYVLGDDEIRARQIPAHVGVGLIRAAV